MIPSGSSVRIASSIPSPSQATASSCSPISLYDRPAAL